MSFTQEATLRRKLLSMQLSQGKEPLRKELSKSHKRCVTVQRGKSIYFMVGG